MQEEAYDALRELENTHWWFIGARYVYQTLIELGLGQRSTDQRMLEVGCGFGGNLQLLENYGPTVGSDLSAKTLTTIKTKPKLGLVQASADALPFAANSFDGVHLFGVIEHLHADKDGMSEAHRVSRKNGIVTLLTSALPILWSHHDEANLHQRRYLRSQLAHLLRETQLVPLRLSYLYFFVFLPVLLIRLLQRIFKSQPKYDMGQLPTQMNLFLVKVVQFEAWCLRRIEFPIGVDLVAVCRVEKTDVGET